ncbi:hypothetical protein [Enterovibrio norvegicus]|nr:hypothetical protein [Enterovibrio norvegicus]
MFSNRLITDVSFDWITTISWLQMTIQYCWQALLYLVGATTVVISAKVNWRAWKTIKPIIKRDKPIADDTHWLLLFAGATVLAIIINAMLSPITFSYWHLILTFPLALIPVLIAAETWRIAMPERFSRGLIALSAFFLVVNLVAAHDSDKYSYNVDYAEQVQQYLIDEGLSK